MYNKSKMAVGLHLEKPKLATSPRFDQFKKNENSQIGTFQPPRLCKQLKFWIFNTVRDRRLENLKIVISYDIQVVG